MATDLLIVGAGFAGLCLLERARRMGLNAVVLEAADGVGGTWYHNRYPGARVDIQSLEYSFGFSDALQQEWQWSERYSAQPELLRYANHIADRFGLREAIHLNTRVEGAVFDEEQACWRVRSADGREWTTRFLAMATGPLSTPNRPAFDGLDRFAGRVLHTADWPHEPVDFHDRHVAVIGTGSSAVQAIPILAREARALTVFQRTPAYAVPARNGPLDPAFERRVKADYPGFRARNRRMRVGFGAEYPPNREKAVEVDEARRQQMFEERWRYGGFSFLAAFSDVLTDPVANEMAAEFLRGKIREIVRDPRTAELLSPRHTLGCKRLCVDTGYYETFNRPNVELVDVGTRPIEAIVERGVVTGGRTYPCDVLVLATGFDAMTGTLTRLDVRGRGGLPIAQAWRDGPVNYLGLMVAGFPNLFNLVGPGSTSAFTTMTVAIEQHVDWIADCIAYLAEHGKRTIEPTPDAQAQWVGTVNEAADETLFLTCNSWYLGANVLGKPRVFMPYAAGFPTYAKQCADAAADGYRGCVLA
ncbi:MAG: NAD(P)/FAD-dependent oxidoreductase [Burkholderiaceae bacterium]